MRALPLFSIFSLAWFGIATLAQAEVTVMSPWVREAPPTAEISAAYMMLHNDGDTDQVLLEVTTPSFNRVEIHQTTMHDDMASMETEDSLLIPAQDGVALVPGGYHLMLIGVKKPLKVGDTVDLSLHFQGGETIEVHAPVHKDTGETIEAHTPILP
ncbi:periplasmic copper chaperone A [Gammaproteobacteria bacterium]